jgi:hypothetical protein
LRLRVQLRVLDRLRDLVGDGDEQVDLVTRELARFERADVQRAREMLPRQDRDREDRLVLVLGQVRELLEARVEMRLGGDHHRRALGRCRPRDSLAGPHPWTLRHLLDPRAVRRPEDELVAALLVQVDEAGLGPECVCDLLGDEREHLLQIERRVDGRDRLGEEAQVALSYVHSSP